MNKIDRGNLDIDMTLATPLGQAIDLVATRCSQGFNIHMIFIEIGTRYGRPRGSAKNIHWEQTCPTYCSHETQSNTPDNK